MENLQIQALMPEHEQEVMATLVYKGKIAAIKLFMKYADCRLSHAKIAVDRLGREIVPGQAC
jgi:ribosomal protein L7/L12